MAGHLWNMDQINRVVQSGMGAEGWALWGFWSREGFYPDRGQCCSCSQACSWLRTSHCLGLGMGCRGVGLGRQQKHRTGLCSQRTLAEKQRSAQYKCCEGENSGPAGVVPARVQILPPLLSSCMALGKHLTLWPSVSSSVDWGGMIFPGLSRRLMI